MDFALYYTLGAIIIYGATDWLLNRIEEARGKRFAQRNWIFFAIMFTLALALMSIINPEPVTPPVGLETGTPSP